MSRPDEPATVRFWRYVIPSVLAMLVTGCYVVVDGIFVGHYVGPVGLAAINLAYPLVMVQIGVGALLSMGASTRIALLVGEGRTEAAGQVLMAVAILALLGGALLALLGLAGLESWLRLLGAGNDETLLREARAYLGWMLGGSPLLCGQMLATYLLRNDGRPRLATALMVASTGLNIGFDYWFVGVLGHGLAGSAQASLIAMGFVVVATVGYFGSARASLRPARVRMRALPAHLADIAQLGASSLMMELNLALVLFAHNQQLLVYGGTQGVAAYAVAGYTEMVFTLVAHGLAVGVQPLLGQAVGGGHAQDARAVLRYGLWTVWILSLCALATIQLFAGSIARLYVAAGDTVLLAASAHALRLHLSALPFDGLAIVGTLALQSMAATRQALALTLGKTVLLLPALYGLPLFFALDGVWLAMPLVNLLLGSATAYLIWLQWQRLGTASPPPLPA